MKTTTRTSPELIASFWPVVLRIAGKLAKRMKGYWTQEELASFGFDGIIGGLRTYNSSYGRSLEDHVARRIKGAILDGISIKRWHFIRRGDMLSNQNVTSIDLTTRRVDINDDLDFILSSLSTRREWIMRAYYIDGWSQERIGRALGISASAVSQHLRHTLSWLRKSHMRGK